MAGKARTRLRHHRWGQPEPAVSERACGSGGPDPCGGSPGPRAVSTGSCFVTALNQNVSESQANGEVRLLWPDRAQVVREARAEEGSTALPARQQVAAALPSPHLCGTGWESGTRTK